MAESCGGGGRAQGSWSVEGGGYARQAGVTPCICAQHKTLGCLPREAKCTAATPCRTPRFRIIYLSPPPLFSFFLFFFILLKLHFISPVLQFLLFHFNFTFQIGQIDLPSARRLPFFTDPYSQSFLRFPLYLYLK